MRTTHSITIYDEKLTIEADWSQPVSPVSWNGEPTDYLAADFDQDPATAMQALVAEVFETYDIGEVAAAISSMRDETIAGADSPAAIAQEAATISRGPQPITKVAPAEVETWPKWLLRLRREGKPVKPMTKRQLVVGYVLGAGIIAIILSGAIHKITGTTAPDGRWFADWVFWVCVAAAVGVIEYGRRWVKRRLGSDKESRPTTN